LRLPLQGFRCFDILADARDFFVERGKDGRATKEKRERHENGERHPDPYRGVMLKRFDHAAFAFPESSSTIDRAFCISGPRPAIFSAARLAISAAMVFISSIARRFS